METKNDTLKFIKDLVDKAISLLYYYCEQDGNAFYFRIANLIIGNLEASQTGMNNLILTYKNDTYFISEIEMLIAIMNEKIKPKKKIVSDKNSFESGDEKIKPQKKASRKSHKLCF